jgi:uroporphyrin-III C-methyltransferase
MDASRNDRPAPRSALDGAARSPGKVWLVGAGPGDPELLTLRAVRLMRDADVILHDALVTPEILDFAGPSTRLIPVGKRSGRLSTAQRFINKRLVDAARAHSRVVRLKGGDPMLFGRAQEEIDALLAAGIPVEVVPGISSAFAASASVLKSLTRRGSSRSVVFVTPRFGEGEKPHDWARPAAAADTVVVYMAGREPGRISDGLIAAGIPGDRSAVIVESASLAGERMLPTRVADLAVTAGELDDGPALLLIGDVFDGAGVAATESVEPVGDAVPAECLGRVGPPAAKPYADAA